MTSNSEGYSQRRGDSSKTASRVLAYLRMHLSTIVGPQGPAAQDKESDE